jgi:hypothetical protein
MKAEESFRIVIYQELARLRMELRAREIMRRKPEHSEAPAPA